MSDTPRQDQVQRQRAFDAHNLAKLELFDLAAILKHVVQDFDFPTGAVSVDQFANVSCARCQPVCQQAPFHRLYASWRPIFGCHYAPHRHDLSFAGVQLDAPCPQLLTFDAHPGIWPGRQCEFNFAERCALRCMRSQLFAVRQTVVLGGAHQLVGTAIELLRAQHQGQHVCLAVRDLHQTRGRQARRNFGQPLVAFDPTQTLFRTAALTVGVTQFVRPHPKHRESRSVRAPLSPCASDARTCHAVLRSSVSQSACLLTIEVKFSRVL